MVDRPILFSAPMVRALLAGTKTQTRRVIEPYDADALFEAKFIPNNLVVMKLPAPGGGFMRGPTFKLPRAVGDRLWVREAWRCNGWATDVATVFYRASESDGYNAMCEQYPVAGRKHLRANGSWRPSIHMPRWVSRLTLTVTEVRVERLHDISEADAIAEGATTLEYGRLPGMPDGDCYHHGQPMPPGSEGFETARASYRCLWDSINGVGAWDANPWVSATTFTVHHQNIDTIPVLPARYGERSTPTPEEERRLFAFEHNGVRVYHCLRWCGQIVREFAYATDPRGIHEDEGDHSFMFDIRDQPGGKALEKAGGCRKLHEAVIRAALDAGPLVMIPDASPPPASKPAGSIWDDGEVPF